MFEMIMQGGGMDNKTGLSSGKRLPPSGSWMSRHRNMLQAGSSADRRKQWTSPRM